MGHSFLLHDGQQPEGLLGSSSLSSSPPQEHRPFLIPTIIPKVRATFADYARPRTLSASSGFSVQQGAGYSSRVPGSIALRVAGDKAKEGHTTGSMVSA